MLRHVMAATSFWRMPRTPLIGLVKLLPNRMSRTLYDLLSWTQGSWDGRMDRQTTVTHYPMSLTISFKHCALVSRFLSLPVSHCSFFVHTTPLLFLSKFSGAGAALSLAIWLWNTGVLGSTSHTVHKREAKRKGWKKDSEALPGLV